MDNIKIPIFIIVHDRVQVLKKSVQSFEEQIKTPIEIIFHDVASTFSECLDYLNEMKEKGYKVYRTEVNHHHTVLESIRKYLKDNPGCGYYVVTDPDIELDRVGGDILIVYRKLIEKFGKHLVVGPMLRIDDIPNYYPKKALAIKLHTEQFWSKTPVVVDCNGKKIRIQHSPIDTTFQLAHCRNLRKFPRGGIRCYAPYAARHLDWYINPRCMSPDQIYYSRNTTKIAHWGRGIPVIKSTIPIKKENPIKNRMGTNSNKNLIENTVEINSNENENLITVGINSNKKTESLI